MEWAEESVIDVKYRELFAAFSFVRTDGEAIPGKPRYVFNCPFECMIYSLGQSVHALIPPVQVSSWVKAPKS